MRNARVAGLLLAPVLALGLAACGGGGAKDETTPQSAKKAGDAAKMRDFARCMREHGVDMKDPDDSGRVMVQQTAGANGGPNADELMKSAQKACRHLMPNNGKPRMAGPQEQEKMRKFAQCMRQHGIDMQDPGADGGVRITMSKPPGQGGSQGGSPADDPKLKAAQEACKQFQPGGMK
ncbi:hypothetical protein DZF91_10910 [Actinomadura logoneensis]|uniref:Secreted protein n=1 Tax=Actinomadura logoneensis TaxID=2293572 RepID=A0A372JNH6_9ACTN|nr:hypothetical protein [Actinomadura logoneensis]RFU41565.1 hypothetical protein DZF91_10910 [Actinomadura logoneensis]